MKPRLIGIIIATFVLAVVAVVIWKPWRAFNICDAPKEFCALASDLKHQEGIDKAEVDYEVTAVDAKDGDSAQASWTVKLDESLAADQAGELAQEASTRIQDFVDGQPLVHSSARFVSGEPQDSDIPDLELYPLDVSAGEDVKDQIVQAFTLRQLGAQSVGQGSAVAKDIPSLKVLGEYAAEHEWPISLALEDSSVRYCSDQPLDLAEFELTLEAATHESVEISIFDSSGLSVHSTAEAGSQEVAQLGSWLKKHSPLQEPTAFTISDAGYADIIEGWVGQKLPESLIARPAQLPDGVSAWPKNSAAPSCTQDDLELSLGSPDAAAGSRYMAVYAKNVSASSCAINGYPKIQFLNAQGESQNDVSLVPMSNILGDRVVIPAGESAMSEVTRMAMSTTNDPDETTSLRIVTMSGFPQATYVPETEGSTTSLDILDGGEVTQSPWLQALDGWPIPSNVGQQPSAERP